MEQFVRPLSRLAAVELQDCELDLVAGGSATGGQTSVYCANPDGSNTWIYDGTHPDPD